MSTRKEHCAELARIFKQYADETRSDQLKSARYWTLAREYEAEAIGDDPTDEI